MLRCSDCCHGSRSGGSPVEQRNNFTRRFLCNYQKAAREPSKTQFANSAKKPLHTQVSFHQKAQLSTRTFEDADYKLCKETSAHAGFFVTRTSHAHRDTRKHHINQLFPCLSGAYGGTWAPPGEVVSFRHVYCIFTVLQTSEQSVFILVARRRMRIPWPPPGEVVQYLACVMHFECSTEADN